MGQTTVSRIVETCKGSPGDEAAPPRIASLPSGARREWIEVRDRIKDDGRAQNEAVRRDVPIPAHPELLNTLSEPESAGGLTKDADCDRNNDLRRSLLRGTQRA
jgi:hypothetical protein